MWDALVFLALFFGSIGVIVMVFLEDRKNKDNVYRRNHGNTE